GTSPRCPRPGRWRPGRPWCPRPRRGTGVGRRVRRRRWASRSPSSLSPPRHRATPAAMAESAATMSASRHSPSSPHPAPAAPTFLGLPDAGERARVAVVCAPYDLTSTYGKGADRGPEALIAASYAVETWDEETSRDLEPL